MSRVPETTEPETPEPAGQPGAGGEPACWADEVCAECGAVVSDGHREGCESAEAQA